MPFRQLKNKVPVWEDPAPARVKEFNTSLTRVKEEVEIPASLHSQLQSFMNLTIQGSKRLVESNKNRAHSLSTVIKRGIHPVDIILPVYGNLQVVEPCIRSLFDRTVWPFHLTIVDDRSPDEKTKYFIREVAEAHKNVTVLSNLRNKGFSTTVNRGINNSKNPYICVLNSDVLVTPNWLTKMVLALEANPKNKIVNPVTNNTALINVPMKAGLSYLDMNQGLEAISSHKYPEVMPTGFCFMFYRSLIEDIGLFDEGFESYGEESDFWMRVISTVRNGEFHQWRAVLADDTYLFHERGTSFSTLGNEKHMSKRQAGSSRFHSIWPQYKSWSKSFDLKKTMEPLRGELPIELTQVEHALYNIAFVVHSASFCGGMKFISDIVNEYIEKGVNVKVALIKRKNDNKLEPSVLEDLHTAPIMFDSMEEFEKDFTTRVFRKGIVVASTCELVDPVVAVCRQPKTHLRSILFAQSDDP